jgi:hypothetical protein
MAFSEIMQEDENAPDREQVIQLCSGCCRFCITNPIRLVLKIESILEQIIYLIKWDNRPFNHIKLMSSCLVESHCVVVIKLCETPNRISNQDFTSRAFMGLTELKMMRCFS